MRAVEHHLKSLDVFRGLTVAAMILVNNPGDWRAVFRPLVHAAWTGLTPADLVFPWFVFIMGAAMPFAFARRRAHGHEAYRLSLRIARRAVTLVALGLVLNAVAGWPLSDPLRFTGVLQRIALTYGVASLMVLGTGPKGWLVVGASLMLGHWALLTQVSFDGFPAGTVSADHNLAWHLDTLLLGRHAMPGTTDPEGMLGTLPAVGTALLGALVGHMMHSASDDGTRVRGLLVVGLATLGVGGVWAAAWPLCKPLWTGSFACVASGLAMLVLALLHAIVDIRRARAWARPLLWLGVNPLAIYFLSELVGRLMDRGWVTGAGGNTTVKAWVTWSVLVPAMRPLSAEWASLTFGMIFVACWAAVAAVLHKHHVRIQV